MVEALVLLLIAQAFVEPERHSVIVRADGPGRATVRQWEWRGVLRRNGAPFTLSVRRKSPFSDWSVSYQIDGFERQEFTVDHQRYPDLDFSSAQIQSISPRDNKWLGMEVRFGQNRPCFSNDDGRNVANFEMAEDGLLRIWVVDYTNCDISYSYPYNRYPAKTEEK